VFEPGQVVWLHGSRKRYGVLKRPAGSAVKGQTHLITKDLLHGFGTGDDLFQAALGQHTSIRVPWSWPPRRIVPTVRHRFDHRRIVKPHRLFHQGEAFLGFLDLLRVLGIISGRLPVHGETRGSVLAANAVASLAPP